LGSWLSKREDTKYHNFESNKVIDSNRWCFFMIKNIMVICIVLFYKARILTCNIIHNFPLNSNILCNHQSPIPFCCPTPNCCCCWLSKSMRAVSNTAVFVCLLICQIAYFVQEMKNQNHKKMLGIWLVHKWQVCLKLDNYHFTKLSIIDWFKFIK
jgi:hypothetical protein